MIRLDRQCLAFFGLSKSVNQSVTFSEYVRYRLELPDPEVLKTELEHERQRLLEMKIVNRV